MRKRLLVLLCFVLTACHQSNTNVPTRSAATPAPPVQTSAPALPSEADVRAAIQRNYEDAVTIDSTRSTPFVTGDFNGDRSEDIAVIVKPQPRKLSDLNSDYANWILEDPQHIDKRSAPVVQQDVLLAVIHGHERDGWRDALARETYLLKNAVGPQVEKQSVNQLRAAGEAKILPQLRGDVIRETLRGSDGVIYWAGGKYAWHPVS